MRKQIKNIVKKWQTQQAMEKAKRLKYLDETLKRAETVFQHKTSDCPGQIRVIELSKIFANGPMYWNEAECTVCHATLSFGYQDAITNLER